MTNKFRGLKTDALAQVAQRPDIVEGGFNGGIVLNTSPQDLQPNQSPDAERVRLHQGGLHQDYGVEDLGTALALRIQALGEHRFILSGGEVFLNIFRAYRQADTYIMVEAWDGNSWDTEHDSTTLAMADVLADWVSYFDALFISDGDSVFKWSQTRTLDDQWDDFTSLVVLEVVDATVSASIVPGVAHLGTFEAFYEIKITGPSAGGASVTVSLIHDGDELAETIHPIEESTVTSRSLHFPKESMKITFRDIASGEDLTLKLKAITQSPVARTNTLAEDSGTPLWKVSKSPTREAHADTYLFTFVLSGSGTSTIAFYTNNGGGWVEQETFDFEAGTHEYPLTVDGLGAGSSFGLHVKTGSLTIEATSEVEWDEPFEVDVEGFNKDTDGDLEYGVVYQTEGSPANTLAKVDKDPGAGTDLLVARYLGVFNNRVIALQVDGDVQKLAHCINGDPLDWIGTGAETGVVLEGRGDPVDELMAFEAVGNNVAALFRYRSIMKVTPTGTATVPFGYFGWIDSLGTESPFSVAKVPGGVMFLGHDRMVYYLTESSLSPVGQPIQDELEDTVGSLEVVEAAYDPVAKTYILAVPTGGGTSTVVSWRFDFQLFASQQQIVWQRHTRTMNRLVTIEGEDVYFIGADYVVRKFDRDSVVDGAYWVSPMLNQKNRQGEFSLIEVTVRYEAAGATTLIIEGSGDGGENWSEGYVDSLTLASTSGGVRRMTQGLNVTGYDLRFRVRFPSDEKVTLHNWRAELVDRSDLEYE